MTWPSTRPGHGYPVNPPKLLRRQQRLLPVALPSRAGPRWRSLLTDRTSLPALIVLAAVLLAAVAAPLIAPHDPARQQLAEAFSPPTSTYLLGADHLGRDVLSRLLHGARATLFSAISVLALAVLIGIAVGAVAGFCAGWVDGLLMRLTDLVLAFPALLLAVAVAGTLGQSLVHVVAALAAVTWAGFARTVRGLVLASREQEYVMAATALGASGRRIIARHILPNVLGPVFVLAAIELGTILLSIAGLNFLGLGAQPPTAEWGAMLRAAQPHLQTYPRLVLYPSAAIMLVVLSANVLADRLRGTLDPTER